MGLEGVGFLFPIVVLSGPGAGFFGGAGLEFAEALFEGVDDLVEGWVGDAAWEDAVFNADFVQVQVRVRFHVGPFRMGLVGPTSVFGGELWRSEG